MWIRLDFISFCLLIFLQSGLHCTSSASHAVLVYVRCCRGWCAISDESYKVCGRRIFAPALFESLHSSRFPGFSAFRLSLYLLLRNADYFSYLSGRWRVVKWFPWSLQAPCLGIFIRVLICLSVCLHCVFVCVSVSIGKKFVSCLRLLRTRLYWCVDGQAR